MGMGESGFSAGETAGTSPTGRELAAAADVGAERQDQRRRQRETAAAVLKRKAGFAALSTGS